MNRAAMDAYRLDQQRRGLSPATIKRRDTTLYEFHLWLKHRGKGVLDATPDDINDWLDTRRLAARARYCYLSNLTCFYRFAVANDFCTFNPARKIDRPKLPRNVPRPIGDDDLRVALELAPQRLRAMVALGAYGGLRCMEIAGLERDDIWEQADPPVMLIRGKGKRERVVPLHPYVWQCLRSFGIPKRGPVFANPDGGPLSPLTVGRLISNFLHDSGIDASAHQLRHWFGVHVYQQSGGDLRLAQDLLGHASPTTTAIYTSWHQPKARAVVAALGVHDPPKARAAPSEEDAAASTPLGRE